MTPTAIAERAEHIAAVRGDATADRAEIQLALAEAGRITAWADAQIGALVAKLAAVESFPEATIAESARCSLGRAAKTKERSDVLAATPRLADALEDGAITTGHVDAVTRSKKKLEPAQHDEFMERAEGLVGVAEVGTIEQFTKRLDLEVKKLQTDGGEARLTRQKRNTRLSTWVDVDGMWNLRGRYDPVTGLKLAAKIERATDTGFATATPDHCPSDPIEKNRFLAAHALAGLVDGAGAGTPANRAEFVAVIHGTAGAPGEEGTSNALDVEWPIPVEVPRRVLAELAAESDIHAVVVRNGMVLHAPGRLDLGRTTRLANRAQRRALRGLYRGCAVPGCTVSYDRCKLHHVVWWRHGGRTDLDNLLPVCSRHHTDIHHDGWTVELAADRRLVLTLPDGRVMNTGPPDAAAA